MPKGVKGFQKGHTLGKGKKGQTPSQKVDKAIKKVFANRTDNKGQSIALFNLFNAMYDKACGGDVAAHQVLMDRYAGKVVQKVDVETTQYLVQIGSTALKRREIDVSEKVETIEHKH